MTKKAGKYLTVNPLDNTEASTANNRIKFTLYNIAGKETDYYLVDKFNLSRKLDNPHQKQVAHSIIIIDRSGSMYYDIPALKETLIKLLTLDEYINSRLVISLISYSSQGDVTCHFQRIGIQKVMRPNSPYLAAIKNIQASYLTCISQSMQLAKSLIKDGEITAITLHSDGYANDSSPNAEARAIQEICNELKHMNVFVNTIAYSQSSDFKLLAKIANTVSGRCIRASNVKEVYDAIYSTAKLLGNQVDLAIEESLSGYYSYQVFLSKSARKINGTNQTLKIFGLKPEDQGIIYKFKQVKLLRSLIV